ncbi:MAG TPA: RecX family transcriptional regulator [Candidatus Sulfomarinibacteraceae bacterium]|nr:RecX family transcriptional regulator [Candidatus Sulfomarinibacteraceae bacterium]
MPIITALEPQKRNKDRVNVHLDGEFAFGLSAEVALGLRIGQSLDEEAIAAIQDEEAYERAKKSAFRFLSYRPRSVTEVRQNLLGKEYDPVLVERVIDYLRHNDYLDDEAFAHYWVEQREAFKPRSRFALRQELYQKGVARAVIDQAVEDVNETAAAERAAAKRARRWAHLPYDEFRQKVAGYLQRRGFKYAIVKPVVKKVWQELNNDEQSAP